MVCGCRNAEFTEQCLLVTAVLADLECTRYGVYRLFARYSVDQFQRKVLELIGNGVDLAEKDVRTSPSGSL